MDQQGNREKSNDSELLVKKQQLHWLLQITKAINYNMPATQLFEIYEIVMREQLKVQNLALFIHESQWKKMLAYGAHENFLMKFFF